jgi:methionyl-tRNA formyltransferase
MRLAFLGTPEFAIPTLEKLVASPHEIVCVITQPDRPKGRSQEPARSPVKEAALRHGLPVFQPERIRRPESVEFLKGLRVDIMVLVGYGQIIPQSIIDIPPHGILNVHASLLPKYRGAAPVQWAIVNGETRTGVTIMRIDAGLDTGDILLQAGTEIAPEEDAVELSARLAGMGADLLLRVLKEMPAGIPQDNSAATLAPILKKEDGAIDWRRPARVVYNRVRGLLPWPGAHTTFRGRLLHVWKARVGEKDGVPGRLWRENRQVYAGCGEGTALELLEVQLEGKARMTAESFANGQRFGENENLGELP